MSPASAVPCPTRPTSAARWRPAPLAVLPVHRGAEDGGGSGQRVARLARVGDHGRVGEGVQRVPAVCPAGDVRGRLTEDTCGMYKAGVSRTHAAGMERVRVNPSQHHALSLPWEILPKESTRANLFVLCLAPHQPLLRSAHLLWQTGTSPVQPTRVPESKMTQCRWEAPTSRCLGLHQGAAVTTGLSLEVAAHSHQAQPHLPPNTATLRLEMPTLMESVVSQSLQNEGPFSPCTLRWLCPLIDT